MLASHLAFLSLVFLRCAPHATCLGVVGKEEIKKHIQNSQPVKLEIGPRGSMTESGDRAAQVGKRRGNAGTEDVNFGGSKHATVKSAMGKEQQDRPEFLKSKVCSATTCTECRSNHGCWHGAKVGNQDGFLIIAVPHDHPWAVYTTEVWARCGSGGGTWEVWPHRQVNAIIDVFLNGESVSGFPKSALDEWPSKMKKRKLKRTKVLIPIKGDSRIRVSLRPIDTKKEASAQVKLSAKKVQVAVDDCMTVKNALTVLGDGSSAAFELRNVNFKQLTCLEGNFGAMSTSLSNKCKSWTDQFSRTQREILRAFLSAALRGASAGMAEDRIGQHLRPSLSASRNTRESCSDPSVDDPESWDCECLQSMSKTCKLSYPRSSLEDCLRTLMCNNRAVCQGWKDEHCEESLVETSITSMDDRRTKVNRSVLQTSTSARGSLDETVAGKCTTSTRF